GVLRMVEQLTAVRSVQAVVEVVPPAPVALRFAHHARDRDRRRRGNEAARLGDDANVLRQLRERFTDWRAERLDGHNVLAVCDRKASTDVEDLERGQPCEQAFRDQVRAGANRLDVLGRIGRLRADVEGQSAHADTEPPRELDAPQHGIRLAAELRRQIDHGARTAKRHPQEQLRTLAIAYALLDLVLIVGDERRGAESERVADVAVALDRVRVDAALRRDALCLYQLHFAGRGEIEIGVFVAQACDYGRVRQRLERIMQIDT